MPRQNLVYRSLLGSAAIALVLLAGCGGPKKLPVRGKLVLPADVKLAPNDTLQVVFNPQSGKGLAPVGTYNAADSTFSVPDPGVPVGSYKVSVSVSPYPDQSAPAARLKALEALNKSFSPNDTKLTYEVAGEGEQVLTVDLVANKVSKN